MRISALKQVIILLAILLTGCATRMVEPSINQTITDKQLAQQTLINFLQHLHEGQYEEAAALYGGTYEIMIEHNPSLDPNNHAGLLNNACAINGAQCLEVKSATFDHMQAPNKLIFQVEFQDDLGKPFVLGPCCGGNETDTPSQSSFTFTVVKNNDGNFLVMDMPPYMP